MRLSFSPFVVLMSMTNGEKDSLLGETVLPPELGQILGGLVFLQGQIFILETAILATPYFQTFHYDGCTAGQKVKSGES